MSDGWIKLNRRILDWDWYRDGATMRVFIHLLLNATSKPTTFKGITLRPGEYCTTYKDIADCLNLSYKQVRTAIGHLKGTGEVTIKGRPEGTHSAQIYFICNYTKYQEKSERGQTKGQAKGQAKGTELGKYIEQESYTTYTQEVKKEKERSDALQSAPPVKMEIPSGILEMFGGDEQAAADFINGGKK